MNTLTPLETLFEVGHGHPLPLPDELTRLYGSLHFPTHRPYILGNFVTTLDGVVSLGNQKGSGGGDISGFNEQDRMVMGLLRAIADAVIVGAGTSFPLRRCRKMSFLTSQGGAVFDTLGSAILPDLSIITTRP